MALLQLVGVSSLLSVPVLAHVTTGREGYGVIGYGISMYDPPCAYACRDTVSGWTLDCGHEDHDMDGMDMDMGGMHMNSPSPECLATNDPFLHTLAWCIHTHCTDDVRNSTLEEWWEMNVAGRQKDQPLPKYSYQAAISQVEKAPPTTVVDSEETLNVTSLVDEDSYLGNYNGDNGFQIMEILNERLGIVLMATCVGIPILFSWLSFLPLPQTFVSKFHARFIDPPVFGQYHAVPVLGLGFVPTRGQALFIAYIWGINIILSAVGYEVLDPMSWYATPQQQLMAYIGNRVGILSFVNLALTVLYSSRNNVLLYVTNWSHSTYLLVHRWIAVICMLQACFHSAIYLQIYLDPASGDGAYTTESALNYWYWGIIATLALALLMPLSILPIRRKIYEGFLASHIILSVLAMIGCFLHMYYRYELQWGYQTWVIIAFAIWGFDRFIARPLRLLKNGVKKAHITVIDEDYLMVQIPDVTAEGQVYLYFPTLTWRVWENHPFSVAAIAGGTHDSLTRSSSSDTPTSAELEKNNAVAPRSREVELIANKAPGILFFVRRRGGLTAILTKHAESAHDIPVLIESSYGAQMSLVQSPVSKPTLKYPNTIFIAGGVGITAVLPLLDRVSSFLPSHGKTKLFWGVRTQPLVDAVKHLLDQSKFERNGLSTWGDVDVSVSVGSRFNFRDVLDAELRETVGGTTVVVCGPPGMADEVRSVVAALGRKGAVVRLTEESFSW